MVKNHTTSVRWREPCVTVFYVKAGEIRYHVDLAIYAKDATGTYLARARESAPPDSRSWEPADPAALVNAVSKRFTDSEEQAQFRRTIRYLKRWKDHNFPSQGNEAPRVIALTACAYRWFTPQLGWHPEHQARRPDDSVALLQLVDAILGRFDGRRRVSASLPVPPGNDLFEKMSATQLATFHAKLDRLRTTLTNAQADPDPHTAANSLVKVFGEDFPVPAKPTTAQKRGPSYVSSAYATLLPSSLMRFRTASTGVTSSTSSRPIGGCSRTQARGLSIPQFPPVIGSSPSWFGAAGMPP